MKIIGITGSSGSGKSTAAKIVAKKLDAKLIVADEIVKKMQEPGNEYFYEIVKLLGKEYLNKDGLLDRRKIAELVFNDELKRKELNKLTEKYVVEEIKREIAAYDGNYIVLDVPLLIESSLNKMCNKTIAVIANRETKIKRICARDKITEKEAKARLGAQPDDEFYKKNADYIIENEGEKDDKFMGRIRDGLQEL